MTDNAIIFLHALAEELENARAENLRASSFWYDDDACIFFD